MTRKQRVEAQTAFLARLASGETVGHAAGAARISRQVVYKWRSSDGEFAAAWDAAWEDGRDALVQEATRRALNGSDLLLMFLIKQRDPSFRENAKLERSGGVALDQPITFQITDSSRARPRSSPKRQAGRANSLRASAKARRSVGA